MNDPSVRGVPPQQRARAIAVCCRGELYDGRDAAISTVRRMWQNM